MRARQLVPATLGLVLAGGGGYAVAGATAPADPQPAVRSPLAATDRPIGAKGRELALTKVVVPSGTKLALHHHAGTQIAFVHAGVLTYTVKTGGVRVMRGPAGEGARLVRRIGPGQTGRLQPGDWIVEQPRTVHRARNAGAARVVLYLATLFPEGAPPSIPDAE